MDAPEIPLLSWAASPCEEALLAMELEIRDGQIAQLKELLHKAIREKKEAQEQCQRMQAENGLLHRQLRSSAMESQSPDSDDSIVSSLQLPAEKKPLPEKGKLLQAVMNAGPLLQTLLLSGPLPQWRHPPPPMDALQIPPPPLVLPNCGRKRSFSDSNASDSWTELKYQRITLQ